MLLQGSRVWFLNQESKWTQGVIHSTDDLDSTVSLVDGQVKYLSLYFNSLSSLGLRDVLELLLLALNFSFKQSDGI